MNFMSRYFKGSRGRHFPECRHCANCLLRNTPLPRRLRNPRLPILLSSMSLSKTDS